MNGENKSQGESTASKQPTTVQREIGIHISMFSVKPENLFHVSGYSLFAIVGERLQAEVTSSILSVCLDAIKEAERQGKLTIVRYASW